MKTSSVLRSETFSTKLRNPESLSTALSCFALAVVLGIAAPASARNGLTEAATTSFDAVDDFRRDAGGDYVVACLADASGNLDGKCASGDVLPFAFRDVDDTRIYGDGERLNTNKLVRGVAFGHMLGTSSSDGVCWTFERSRPKPFESLDVKVCAEVVPDALSLSSPSACGIGRRPQELLIQQDADLDVSLCSRAETRLKLEEDSIAYLFAADTTRLAEPRSATLTTCSGFVAQCVDPEATVSGVTARSTRPIFAYDGDPWGGYGKW